MKTWKSDTFSNTDLVQQIWCQKIDEEEDNVCGDDDEQMEFESSSLLTCIDMLRTYLQMI